MIPAADGGYRGVRELKLADEAGLRDLLTPDLLGPLYGEDHAITFASEAISEIAPRSCGDTCARTRAWTR